MQRHLIAARDAAHFATVWLARHRRTPAILVGFVVGMVGWSAAHPFVAVFGFTRDVWSGLLFAAVFSLSVGSVSFRRWKNDHGLPELLSVAWLVLLPTLLAAAAFGFSKLPLHWMELEALRVIVFAAAGLFVFGLPAACVGRSSRRFADSALLESMLVGAGLGVVANALLVAPLLGLQLPLLAMSVATAIAWLVFLVRGHSSSIAVASGENEIARSLFRTICAGGSIALIGISCAVCSRSLIQLFPAAAYLVAVGIGTFLIGGSIGSAFAARLRTRTGSEVASRRLGAALAAFGVALPLAAFPWLVHRNLDANAFVSSVGIMMSIRSACVVAALLMISLGCGLIAARHRAVLVAATFATGLVVGAWIVPTLGIVLVAVASCCGLIGFNVGPLRSTAPRTRLGWTAFAVSAAVLLLTLPRVGNYDPTMASQLLFSTEIFVSHQRGVPAKLLPYLSDRRIVATSEEAQGTLTLWKSRGETYEARLNGVPLAATSRRTAICPAPSGDVMSVALPLVLHQAPGSMLILGDAIGTSTQVAAGFPVREIVCYDGLLNRAETVTARSEIVARDNRVSASKLEPRLAIELEGRTFDVVVSDPGPPAVLSNSGYFTREFYRSAAARLSPDGIFCQRLRYADYGIEPLRVIAATLRNVFGDSMLMEIGPGEYALIGVRPGQRIVRDGLPERLQRPHVRKTLASIGWDWCVPLNLLAVDQSGLTALADEATGINTAANAHFAYALPREMMRWGPKSQELSQGTANRTTRLLVTAVPEDDRRDIVDRIAEVSAQRELMVRYPDQPWAYRKEVRAKLVEAPRSVIRPVSGEVKRVRHPDDQHRLDYFEALGKAIGKTSPDTLAKLERFAEPYDPFVTYFLHHEIAPLYRKGGHDVAGELGHRLHAAYFGDPRDRSVRDVAATIELIASHPEVIGNDTHRFDTLNSLIEVMLGRWEARGMAEPRSPEVAMIDIEKCLDATSLAIEEMAPLAVSAGLTDEEWQLRKAAIERTMTRPLRKYRTTLLPHLRIAQQKAAALAEKAEAETIK